jgi:hypothetical protein
MSKKQKSKKNLKKSLSVILDTYTGQKGKTNRKKLSDFIEQKISEILSFRDNLRLTGDAKKPPVVSLQPSPALADELHKNINNGLKFKNAIAIQ